MCNELANRGIRVVVAGLDMDFKGVPFGPIPALCAIADEVTKVHAICVKCGALAYVSHRLVPGDKRVMLGEQSEYEPLCRECYRKAVEEERMMALTWTRSRALPAARGVACCDAKDGLFALQKAAFRTMKHGLLQDCSQRLGSQLLTPQCGKGLR